MSLCFRHRVTWLFLLIPFLLSLIVMSLHFNFSKAENYGIVSLILHSVQFSFNRTSTYQPCIDAWCSSGEGTDIPVLDMEGAFGNVGEERISLHNSSGAQSMYSPAENSFVYTHSPSPVHSTRKDASNQFSYSSRGSVSTSSNLPPSVNHDMSTKVLQNFSKLFTIPTGVPFRPSKSVLSRFNRVSGVHPSIMQSPSNATRLIYASKYWHTLRVSRNVTSSTRVHPCHDSPIPLATRLSPRGSYLSIPVTHASYQSSPTTRASSHSPRNNILPHSSPSPTSHHSLLTTPRKPKRSRKALTPISFPPIIPCSNIQFYNWGDSISTPPLPLSPRLPRTMRCHPENPLCPIR